MYSEFESFAPQITEAAGSRAETVAINADNTPNSVIAEVTRLGELFGTEAQSEAWVAEFKAEIGAMAADITAALGDCQDPAIVAQVFTTWLADLISSNVTVFGPATPTVSEVHELTTLQPLLVLDNIHISSGSVLPDAAAWRASVSHSHSAGASAQSLSRMSRCVPFLHASQRAPHRQGR